MFKQVKSALFWYYLYKFRRRVILIAFLLLIAIFSNAIYSDLIEYLKLKDKLEYLEIVLLSKWVIIIGSILISIFLVLTVFKSTKKDEEKESKTKIETKKDIEKKEELNQKFSKREQEFLKRDLKSKADFLVER